MVDDAFITQHFDWNRAGSGRLRVANVLLRLLRFECRFASPRGTGAETNVEQRMNMFHLASQVLAYGVPGDAVEIGTRRGGSAALIETVFARLAPERRLHLFNAVVGHTPDAVVRNFRLLGLRPPIFRAGPLRETLPAALPGSVCFAHLDIGWGQPPAELRESTLLSLSHLYPRLARGAVLLVADYCDPHAYERDGFTFPRAISNRSLWNLYPPIKEACDAFFADKPERVCALYAGHYSHGYVRKQ